MINSAVSAVHVCGESGTGKEIVADLLAAHLHSSTPFVKVNCGAITPSLLESELFGHVRGAFTGAITDKKGLIEVASGGWIFLDEIASLSLSAQAALLRVLENQELFKVGSHQRQFISIRVLSATNEALPDLVRREKFRQDLWQRLCETEILLPPLRERKEEIEPLVKYFCERMPGGPYSITEPALRVLSTFSWKSGNVRELRNCLRAMTEFHVNRTLSPLSIPERVWKASQEERHSKLTSSNSQGEIRLQVNDDCPCFASLTDKLLLELIKRHRSTEENLSLRKLAKKIGISKTKLSEKYKIFSERNLLAPNSH